MHACALSQPLVLVLGEDVVLELSQFFKAAADRSQAYASMGLARPVDNLFGHVDRDDTYRTCNIRPIYSLDTQACIALSHSGNVEWGLLK